MKTIKWIFNIISSGFGFSKTMTSSMMTVTSTEGVYVELGHPERSTEDGGWIARREDEYVGGRKYFSPKGKLIFFEILPVERCYKYVGGSCPCCSRQFSHYELSAMAKPPVSEFEVVKTTLTGRFCWVPWKISFSRIILPARPAL